MTNEARKKQSREPAKSYYRDGPDLTPEYINWNFPVRAIRRSNTFLEVVRASRFPPPGPKPESEKRSKIVNMSRKSMSRLTCLARENAAMFKSLITLTYGAAWPQDGDEVKEHLGKILSWLRRRYPHQSYLWFLEFQRRGAPHFHILHSLLPNDLDRVQMALYWASGLALKWGDEMTPASAAASLETYIKILKVHAHNTSWSPLRKVDGAARYVVKYATKEAQKSVPEEYKSVGRFWGSSADVTIPEGEEEAMDEAELRNRLRVAWQRDMDSYDVLPKYIYLFDDEGDGSAD